MCVFPIGANRKGETCAAIVQVMINLEIARNVAHTFNHIQA